MSDRNFSKIQVVTDSLAFLILEQLAEAGFFDSLEASPLSLFPAVVYVWDKQQLFGYVSSFFFTFFFFVTCCLIDAFKVPITGEDWWKNHSENKVKVADMTELEMVFYFSWMKSILLLWPTLIVWNNITSNSNYFFSQTNHTFSQKLIRFTLSRFLTHMNHTFIMVKTHSSTRSFKKKFLIFMNETFMFQIKYFWQFPWRLCAGYS